MSHNINKQVVSSLIMKQIIWTDYFKYRVELRGFNLSNVEEILRYSTERYYDTATERLVVVGKDASILIIIPHEMNENEITPITIHATSRQQINYRIKSGRYENE
jgi:hypothetical protein